MRMKKRYGLFVVMAFLLSAAVFAGCGGKEKVTADSLMEEVAANMENVDSAHMNLVANIVMGIKQSGISMDLKMDIDMDMEVTNDPAAAHIQADLSMSLMGISMEMESYSVEEAGKLVTYSGTAGEWTRQEQSLDQKSAGMNAMITGGTSYELQDKTEKVDGREVYVLNGKVSGKYMEGVMGDVSNGMGSVPIDWSKMEMDMVIKIDKKTKRPVEAEIDCGDTLGELMKGSMGAAGVDDAEISIDEFVMTCTYKSFNDVDEIVVPEDVKAAAKSVGSSGGSSDSLEDFLNNSQPESDLPDAPSLPAADGRKETESEEEGLTPNADGTYTLKNYWGADKSVKITVPSGYEISPYSDSQYLSFDAVLDRDYDYVSLLYMLEEDYSEEDMTDYYMSNVDYYRTEEEYSDLNVQEKKTVQVNGRDVSYVKFTYVYDDDSYYAEYNMWTFLPDGQVVQCEAEERSYDGPCDILDDNIVETVMLAVQG